MSALALWDSVWIGALASTILYGSYRAVEWRWPERYIGMHETFGLSSQETWLRFLGYRALPTFVIAASCFVTLDRLNAPTWVAAAVIWALSVIATHGRVAVAALRSSRGEVNYAGYHLQMVVLLTGVIAIALLAAPAWKPLVPTPSELVSALWSGLLVAGLGGALFVILRPRSESAPYYGPRYFIDRASKDVGIEVLDWLFLESIRTGADPILLKALLVVEVVQRPKWFRQLEAVGAWLGLKTTTGAMQMPSRQPLSDRESITRAAEEYAGTWSLRYIDSGRYSLWEPDLGDLWPVATRHNGDAKFAEAVLRVAGAIILGSPTFHYTNTPEHGLVLELRRLPQEFVLRGVSRASTLRIIEFRDGETAVQREVSIPGASPGQWRAWQTRVSPTAHQIAVVDMPSGSGTILALERGEVSSADTFSLHLDHDSIEGAWVNAEPAPQPRSRPARNRVGVPRTSRGRSALWSSSSGARRRRRPR